MRNQKVNTIVLVFISALLFIIASAVMADENAKTMDAVYPGLVSGALTHAVLGELPDGTVLRAKGLDVTEKSLDSEMAKMPEEIKKQMDKNRLFLLEQMSTRKLLLLLAQKDGGTTGTEETENAALDAYFDKITNDIAVTDKEVAEFYDKNKDLCGGTPLEKMAADLKNYIIQQKRQDAVKEHVRDIGKNLPVTVSASWIKAQAALAADNPVDKLRSSGKPSLVDFGSTGCRPCEMMAPILETLTKKYEGKINVLFVHVNQERILGARYGIQSIPVQVFFDKTGREVFRHVGFYSQEEIEKKFEELGMK